MNARGAQLSPSDRRSTLRSRACLKRDAAQSGLSTPLAIRREQRRLLIIRWSLVRIQAGPFHIPGAYRKRPRSPCAFDSTRVFPDDGLRSLELRESRAVIRPPVDDAHDGDPGGDQTGLGSVSGGQVSEGESPQSESR
jgi:hypothetical protein